MISLLAKFIWSAFKPKTQPQQVTNDDSFWIFGNSDELVIHEMLGTVTNLCPIESYGLINHGIYFSFEVVFGNTQLKVGDQVFVSANREHKWCGFIASSVTLNELDWNSKNFHLGTPTHQLFEENYNLDDLEQICGIVTEIHDSYGFLDKKYKFYIKDKSTDNDNFSPKIGDCILGYLISSKSGDKVISWKPNKQDKIEGIIKSLDIGWGIINEDVVFFIESCQCNFPLACGLKVWAYIVESQNPPYFIWRAFMLQPFTIANSSPLKPHFQESDKLYIEGCPSFGNVIISEEKSMDFKLHNNNDAPLNVIDVRFQKPMEQCPFSIGSINFKLIQPMSYATIKIVCKASSIGQDSDILIIELNDFLLRREIKINVCDPAQNLLNPKAPYDYISNKQNLKEIDSKVIIPGQKIFFPKANFERYKVPSYFVPKNLRRAVESLDKQIVLEIAPVLWEDLNYGNYVKKFDVLLHLEEIQMNLHMKKFEMSDCILIRHGQFLTLEVLGLAEGRPSLLMGDKVYLHHPNSVQNSIYEGYIHEVHQNKIFLKFHEEFQMGYNGETYHVSFSTSRSYIKALHNSIRHATKNIRCILFPPKDIILKNPLIRACFDETNSYKSPQHYKKIIWNNSSLNAKQKLAVLRILEARCRPFPYIVFGPPGTGKTITLVEAVLQIYQNFENAKILICTPSNSAADLFTERLLGSEVLKSHELVRLNSYQRNIDSVPDFIKPFCQDKEKIMNVVKFPIIICTCSTATILYETNVTFTHVFIDEACQLTEPDSLIPIGVIGPNGSLIMAGDNKQLGAVLLSSMAVEFGLAISYSERMMNHPVYSCQDNLFSKNNGYNPNFITMLTDCYRMHPSILWCPSTLFYNSQLKCSCPETNYSLSGLDFLPKKGFPIIFHSIQGLEEREENSPSWFNSSEVVEVNNYMRLLYRNNLKPDDIGIIAPYRKQVEKLKLFFITFALPLCKIGSVEEFQGQERKVIIISTVRSNDYHVQDDVLHNLGFLSNPKRFNVAITRAMQLLIVVGNPVVLSQDDHWGNFIRYCQVNGGYMGWLPSSHLQNDDDQD